MVENDCKLAAVAERWRGAAQDADDIVYVLAGMRTGAGLILDGTLRRGFGGAAGEIGALKAVRWLAAPGHLQNCPGVPGDIHPNDKVAWVFERAREGDRDAKGALRRYVKDLAVGTAALVLALDPQVVVLGGGYSRSADLIIDPLLQELERLCLRVPEVRASNLGADSVALGALRVALDQVDAGLFADGHARAAHRVDSPDHQLGLEHDLPGGRGGRVVALVERSSGGPPSCGGPADELSGTDDAAAKSMSS